MAMNDVTQEQAFDFTRASTKWVWDGTGTLVEVPVDQPAYDHDPVTGEALGVLIEPGATNLMDWSEDLTNWQDSGVSGGVVYSPTGGVGGTGYVTVTDGGVGRIRQSFSLSIPTSNVVTRLALRAGTYSQSRLGYYSGGFTTWANTHIDIVSGPGVIGSAQDGQLPQVAELSTTEWTIVELRPLVDIGTSPTGVAIYLKTGEIGEDRTLDIGYVQVEEGSVATSYIPTAGAPVTRAVDNMSRDLGAEFNGREGTLYVEYVALAPAQKSNTYALSLSDGTAAERVLLGRYGGNHMTRQVTDTTTQKYIFIDGFQFGDRAKTASTFGTDTPILASGGQSVSGVIPGIPKNLTTMTVGNTPGIPMNDSGLNGYVKTIRYYPYAMTAAELEELTTL